jgi:hypothetical protein
MTDKAMEDAIAEAKRNGSNHVLIPQDGKPRCRCCGYVTSERGPFGEALHTSCWEEEDELIDSLST